MICSPNFTNQNFLNKTNQHNYITDAFIAKTIIVIIKSFCLQCEREERERKREFQKKDHS